MNHFANIELLRGVVAVLRTIPSEQQIYSLRKLVKNHHGKIEFGHSDGRQRSLIKVNIFGVQAASVLPEDLADAWLRSAEQHLTLADINVGDVA